MFLGESMQERRNFYRILGVQPDADADVIQTAYRTWMQKLGVHPDRGGDHAVAASVNAAYRILRSPARRAAYDRDLARRWNQRELAGVRAGPAPGRSTGGPAELNRRNYYRVLGVQQAAPRAIVLAAHAARRAGSDVDQPLVDEAVRVLGDPVQRVAYDAWLAQAGHVAAARIAMPPCACCLFCKTPHGEYPGSDIAPQCWNCTAPLGLAPLPGGESGRQLARRALDAPLSVHESWPPRCHEGRLVEFAPAGVAATLPVELDVGAIVRLETVGFAAVAAVVHASASAGAHRCGMQLLRARFAHGGMIVDARS